MEQYDIQKCIGEGSFGKAYLCIDLETDEYVVVKQINLAGQPLEVVDSTFNEVKVLEMLNHPNIVGFKDSFMDEDDFLYIVMEYCSGGDLAKRIEAQNGKRFSEEQILTWLSQLCLALQHLHKNKVLHRDIKSQNIFLDGNGNVKLGDFGIAKCLDHTNSFAQTVVGSPFYLSPEICQGVPYNAKTDIWSLGCVLYEMCTLQQAFSGSCIGGIVMKILRSEQPPIPGEYSSDLQNLVDWMLQKSAGRRPTTTQIMSQLFMKPYVPVATVTSVVIPRMSEKKIAEKRPQSKLYTQKKTKHRPKQPDEKIDLCMIVKPLQKIDEEPIEMKSHGQPIRHQPRRKVRKPSRSDPIFEPITNSLSKPSSDDKDKPQKKKIPKKPVFEPVSDEEDELARVTEFESPPAPSREATIGEIEGMRAWLEEQLGTQRLLEAYRLLKSDASEDQVMKAIGNRNRKAALILQRLIISEENLQ